MYLYVWFKRIIFSQQKTQGFSSLFGVLSLTIGVSVLTIAMLAINGFYIGLKKVIVQKSGHIIINSPELRNKNYFNLPSRLMKDLKETQVFLSMPVLIVYKDKFKPLLLEGVTNQTFKNSFSYKPKDLNQDQFFILGKSIASYLNLNPNDKVKLILNSKESVFSKRATLIPINDIRDFGKHDFNLRYGLVSLSFLQKFSQAENQVSGMKVWLKDPKSLASVKQNLLERFPEDQIFSWRETEREFFEIIESDKNVILLVLLILILVAGFNISSMIFLQVFQKTKEIGILKTMGGSSFFIMKNFMIRSLTIGLTGTILGCGLGYLIFAGLLFLQRKFEILPQAVYETNIFVIHWNLYDLGLVFLAGVGISLLASWLPALKACKMPIKEALRYE